MNYSAVIAVARIGLPITALGLVASIFLIDEGGGVAPGITMTERQEEALGQGLEITRPTFSGVTATGAPFTLRAATAVPDAAPATQLEVRALQGEIETEEDTVRFAAPAAQVDLQAQRATSEGAVVITMGAYAIHAARLRANLAVGTVTGLGGVTAEGPGARIEADRAVVSGREVTDPARLRFEGNVRVRYEPATGAIR